MRRNSFILLLAVACISLSNASEQDKPIKVIVFGAHPDDCDSGAGGTAIKFAQLGHEVKFVSLTNGDAGHQSMGGGAMAKIRIAELKKPVNVLVLPILFLIITMGSNCQIWRTV